MDEEQEYSVILKNINDYLATRPNAADTIEGILHWWVQRRQFEVSLKLVHRALEHLVDQGVLSKTSMPGGTIVYRCNVHS